MGQNRGSNREGEKVMGPGKGGSVLVHVGTNNVESEGTTAVVRKYRQLVRTVNQTQVEQIIMSGIIPVIRRMAINMLGFIKVKRMQQCLRINSQQ